MSARISARAWRRRAGLGLCTVLGLAKRGFFIPYRYAATLPGPGRRDTYGVAETLFEAHRGDFEDVLRSIDGFAEDLSRIGDEPPPAPRWQQSWFPRLDAAAAYAFVRQHRPRRIVEVGSGHSTRFLARAVGDGGLETRITAIDPAPRAPVRQLAIDLRRQVLSEAGSAPFRELEAGDFLMIDSSHILMPGSDVDVLLGHVLPALPMGVFVHVHDIFLPDDYPPDWDWRGYNEQLGVLALMAGGGWTPRFASRYVATRMADAVAGSFLSTLPLPAEALESGLWLEKTGGG